MSWLKLPPGSVPPSPVWRPAGQIIGYRRDGRPIRQMAGAANGLGNPYGLGAATSATASLVLTITSNVARGDAVILGIGSSVAGSTITAVTDSQGNLYQPYKTTATNQFGQTWAAFGCLAMTSGTDTITVTFSSASGQKNVVALGCTGILGFGSAVDTAAAVTANGSSAAPTATTGTLANAGELVVGLINNGNGGGSPTSVTSGWTQVEQEHTGALEWSTLYYEIAPSTTAVTLAGSIVSTTWSVTLVPFIPTAPGQICIAFPVAGTGTFVSPVSKIDKAEAWGAGGAGGGGATSDKDGGGGASGEYAAETNLVVTAGHSYSPVTGTGGTGVAGATGGGGSGSSFPGDAITVSGHGGGPGTSAVPGVGGGAGSGSANAVHHSGANGGAGGSGASAGGGGGASSAGPAAAGTVGGAGTSSAAGAAGTQVAGGGPGAAGSLLVVGNAPLTGPGGGGGGAGAQVSGTKAGGAGANGLVQLTYTVQSPWGLTDQAGYRPRWGTLTRYLRSGGQFFQPVPQVLSSTPPQNTMQSGYHPRWAAYLRYLNSRERDFEVPWGQGSQGIQFPLWSRQGGRSPKWAIAIQDLRTRKAEPGWGQGQLGQAYPSVTKQAGSRPRWAAYLRRGKFFQPGWGQGNQGVPFPFNVRQPGSHPRWAAHIRAVKSRLIQPGWGQGNQGVAFPLRSAQAGARPRWAPTLRNAVSRQRVFQPIPAQVVLSVPPTVRQAGYRPRWAPYLRYLVSRERDFEVPWGQGSQGVAYPSVTKQAGSRPRWAAYIRRGHQFLPGLGQANQGQAYPTVTRQAGYRPRWAPYIRRGKTFIPGLGQGNQGVAFPLFTRQPGNHPRWMAHEKFVRGRVFLPGWGQSNQGVQSPLFMDQPGWKPKWLAHEKLIRSRTFMPGWGQANQGQAYPSVTHQAGSRPRWAAYIRRGKVFLPGWGQAGQGVAFPLWTRQGSYSPKWVPLGRLVHGRRFEPGWGQGNQGVAFPLWTRQPGASPKQLPTVRRSGMRLWSTTPPFQGPSTASFIANATMSVNGTVGGQFPFNVTQPGYHPRWATWIRKSKLFVPGLGQGNQGVRFPLATRQSGYRPKWPPHERLVRGRIFLPGWGQGLGAAYPTFLRPTGAHPRWAPYIRRGNVFLPGWGQSNQGVAFPFSPREAGYRPKWPPHQRLVRGRVFVPGLGQGAQGAAYPSVTRQAGYRPRWAALSRYVRSAGQFIAPAVPPSPLLTLFNTFEGGTSGATITTGNSGGQSGAPFDAVNIGASATLTFDNANTAHGGEAAKFVTPVSAVNTLLEWTSSLTASTLNQAWFRVYVYLNAIPGTTLRLVEVRNGSTLCAAVGINSAGKVVALDASGAARTTSTTAVPLNRWFRLEGYFIGSATAGQVQVQIFTTYMDEVTPDETNTTASTLNTNGPINRIDYGNPSSVANYTFWTDDIGVSQAGYLGPVQPSFVPVLHRQPGSRPKWLAHVRAVKSRSFQPPWPQGGQGTVFPLFTRASARTGSRSMPVRRGHAGGIPVTKATQLGTATFSATATMTVEGTIVQSGAVMFSATATMVTAGARLQAGTVSMVAAAGMTVSALAGGDPVNLWNIYLAAADAAAMAIASWNETAMAGGTAGETGIAYGGVYDAQLAASQAYANWLAAWNFWRLNGFTGDGPG